MTRSGTYAPGIAAFVSKSCELLPPDYFKSSFVEMRAGYRRLYEHWRRPRPVGVTVRDRVIDVGIGKVPIRFYRATGEGAQGVLFYFHGGGWVLGNLDSHDDICAELADEVGATVISIDYPLAPENRYPAAYDASHAVVLQIIKQSALYEIDPAKVVLAGDSAGGGIAAALSARLQAEGGPRISAQLLIYPGLGADQLTGVERGGTDNLLSLEELELYRNALFGEHLPVGDAQAFPLLASSFADSPPTHILAAGLDPLLVDSQLYHQKLNEAGARCELNVLEGVVHGAIRARALCPVVDLGLTRMARFAMQHIPG